MSHARSYLNRPYQRVLIPDAESGTVTAMIAEFPGCVTQGNGVQEAYANLEEAAESWIEAAMELGQEIPLPAADQAFSGRVLLRLPKSVHRQAAEAAERDCTSLNQFILAAVAEKVGAARVEAGAVIR
ncbi:MAG: toxin-antitoxin system HicB family antitoxin [Longimicrobiales bacterium]|nr:toxin-antitoxin system HicB family antitoxin [Longimicrobiales bacterium]